MSSFLDLSSLLFYVFTILFLVLRRWSIKITVVAILLRLFNCCSATLSTTREIEWLTVQRFANKLQLPLPFNLRQDCECTYRFRWLRSCRSDYQLTSGYSGCIVAVIQLMTMELGSQLKCWLGTVVAAGQSGVGDASPISL